MPHGRRLDSIGKISIPRAVASRSCLKVDVFAQCVKVSYLLHSESCVLALESRYSSDARDRPLDDVVWRPRWVNTDPAAAGRCKVV